MKLQHLEEILNPQLRELASAELPLACGQTVFLSSCQKLRKELHKAAQAWSGESDGVWRAVGAWGAGGAPVAAATPDHTDGEGGGEAAHSHGGGVEHLHQLQLLLRACVSWFIMINRCVILYRRASYQTSLIRVSTVS